ncbi:MAG: tripartite tricarboxylate transporter TctB family protein [Proteobacteria bacterium]|nr:tripartite tricarboxylate transporter TctB family protein [Pseudomonadota bacterium]
MSRPTPGQWFEVFVWIAFAAFAYAASFTFDREIEMYRFGAAGWPRVVIGLIVVAALGQFLQNLKAAPPAARHDPGASGKFSEHGPRFYLRMGITLALPIVYAGLLNGTGYYFTTPLFLAAYLYMTGVRAARPLILVPLVIYAVVTFIFTRILYVGLPVGYWPGFYDFSNWLIVLIR